MSSLAIEAPLVVRRVHTLSGLMAFGLRGVYISDVTKRALPHCDELFMKYFDRWYDEGDRKRKLHQATCPDVASGMAPVGTPASQLTPLGGETLKKVSSQVERM